MSDGGFDDFDEASDGASPSPKAPENGATSAVEPEPSTDGVGRQLDFDDFDEDEAASSTTQQTGGTSEQPRSSGALANAFASLDEEQENLWTGPQYEEEAVTFEEEVLHALLQMESEFPFSEPNDDSHTEKFLRFAILLEPIDRYDYLKTKSKRHAEHVANLMYRTHTEQDEGKVLLTARDSEVDEDTEDTIRIGKYFISTLHLQRLKERLLAYWRSARVKHDDAKLGDETFTGKTSSLEKVLGRIQSLLHEDDSGAGATGSTAATGVKSVLKTAVASSTPVTTTEVLNVERATAALVGSAHPSVLTAVSKEWNCEEERSPSDDEHMPDVGESARPKQPEDKYGHLFADLCRSRRHEDVKGFGSRVRRIAQKRAEHQWQVRHLGGNVDEWMKDIVLNPDSVNFEGLVNEYFRTAAGKMLLQPLFEQDPSQNGPVDLSRFATYARLAQYDLSSGASAALGKAVLKATGRMTSVQRNIVEEQEALVEAAAAAAAASSSSTVKWATGPRSRAGGAISLLLQQSARVPHQDVALLLTEPYYKVVLDETERRQHVRRLMRLPRAGEELPVCRFFRLPTVEDLLFSGDLGMSHSGFASSIHAKSQVKVHSVEYGQAVQADDDEEAVQVLFGHRKLAKGDKDEHRYVLVEHIQQSPPVVPKVGMASNMYHYYQQRDLIDHFEVDQIASMDDQAVAYTRRCAIYGSLEELPPDKTPRVVSTLSPGESLLTLENNMYRAELYAPPLLTSTKPESGSSSVGIGEFSDFLLIKQADPVRPRSYKFMVSELPPVLMSGHAQTTVEVPCTASRDARDIVSHRITVYVSRLYKKKQVEQQTSNPQLSFMEVQAAFPDLSSAELRRRLKMCNMEEVDDEMWTMSEDASVPSESELRSLVSPEMVCAFESMQHTEQLLRELDVFIWERDTDELMADVDAIVKLRKVIEAVQKSPWGLTDNYNRLMEKRAIVSLPDLMLPDLQVRGGKWASPKELLASKPVTEMAASTQRGSRQTQVQQKFQEQIDNIQTLFEHERTFASSKKDAMVERIMHTITRLSPKEAPGSAANNGAGRSTSTSDDHAALREQYRQLQEARRRRRSAQSSAGSTAAQRARLESHEDQREYERLLREVRGDDGGLQANETLIQRARGEAVPASLRGEFDEPVAPGKQRVLKKTITLRDKEGNVVTQHTVYLRDEALVDLYLEKRRAGELDGAGMIPRRHPGAAVKIGAFRDGELSVSEARRVRAQLDTLAHKLPATVNAGRSGIGRSAILGMDAGKSKRSRKGKGRRSSEYDSDSTSESEDLSYDSSDGEYDEGVSVSLGASSSSVPSLKFNLKTPATKRGGRRRGQSSAVPDYLLTSQQRMQKKKKRQVVNRNEKAATLCELLLLPLKAGINRTDLSTYFALPVSKDVYPDYYHVIKNPMDLSAIETKLNGLEYSTRREFLRDVRQIAVNCHTYCDTRFPVLPPLADQLVAFIEAECEKLSADLMDAELEALGKRKRPATGDAQSDTAGASTNEQIDLTAEPGEMSTSLGGLRLRLNFSQVEEESAPEEASNAEPVSDAMEMEEAEVPPEPESEDQDEDFEETIVEDCEVDDDSDGNGDAEQGSTQGDGGEDLFGSIAATDPAAESSFDALMATDPDAN